MDFIFLLFGLYFTFGLCVSLFFFFTKALAALDVSAQGSSYAFKLIILPGLLVFWPFLLRKYFTKKSA